MMENQQQVVLQNQGINSNSNLADGTTTSTVTADLTTGAYEVESNSSNKWEISQQQQQM